MLLAYMIMAFILIYITKISHCIQLCCEIDFIIIYYYLAKWLCIWLIIDIYSNSRGIMVGHLE